eukprot:scaffold17977_cov59-Cylindrotheca_fusiformis.AAC.1
MSNGNSSNVPMGWENRTRRSSTVAIRTMVVAAQLESARRKEKMSNGNSSNVPMGWENRNNTMSEHDMRLGGIAAT